MLLMGTGDLRELADISPDEFLKLLEYGCRVAEEIARKNRMRPCFKNIQSLCANTRCDILLPNNNISNIHTQGLSWITKDFIYAFIRLINTWNLLRQYVGFRPGSLGNVERALGCGFSRCFQQWEGSSRDLTYFLMRMFCLINNTVEAQMQYQRAWNEEQQETPPVSSAINYPTPQQSVDPQLANQQYVEQQYVDQFGLPIPQSLLGSMGTGDLLHTLSIFKNISDNESAHSKDNQNEPESEEPNRLDVPEENKDTDITVLKAYNQHKRTDSSSSSSSGMSYAGAVPEQDLVKKDESIPFRRHSDLSYNTFQPLPQDNSWMHMSQPSTSQYDATSSHYGELSQYDQNLTYGDSLHYVDPSHYIDPSLYGQSSGNDQTVPYVEESGSGNIPPYGDPVYFEELSRYMYNTFQSTPPPSVSVPPPQPSVHIPNEPGIQEILEQNLESFAPFELNTPQNPVVHFPQRTESRIVIPQSRVPDQDLSNLAAAGQVARAFKPEKVFEIEGGGLTMAGYVTLEELWFPQV
nr:uncharacterized protein LOC111414257 [Onthophagus taurus]